MDDVMYVLCKHCDHFVEENIRAGDLSLAKYIHLEDGEQEFDHDAEPLGEATLADWRRRRPDLFTTHPDGKIGPNSSYHSRRGKLDARRTP